MYQLPQFFEEAIFTGIGCGKIMPSAEKEFDADTDVKGGEANISDIPEETEDNAPDLVSEETAAMLVLGWQTAVNTRSWNGSRMPGTIWHT